MDEDRGFTAQVSLDEIDEAVKPIMLNVLNTGTTFSRVQRIRGTAGYYIHKDLYKTLARIRAREYARGSSVPQLESMQRRPASHGGSLTPNRVAIEDHHTLKIPVTDSGEVARTDYVSTLVEALGMPPEAFLEIPGLAFTAASAASEAFAHARQSNRLLDEELTERDEQARVAVERAFARLEASLAPTDDWKRQQLVAAYQEVDHNWPVLMLMPNGPYETVLRGVVEQLEPDNATGSLGAEESALYSVAKRLVAALSEGDRNSDRTWIRLEAVFLQLARSHPQVAQGDGKRTLN
jgi:hypothetical protein